MQPHEDEDAGLIFDPEEEKTAKERVDGEIDAERLAALELDLELLALLPAGDVEGGGEVGAEWELEPEALRRFFCAASTVDSS